MANDDIEHEKILQTNGVRKLASLLALTNLSSLRRSSFCGDGAQDANPDSSAPCRVSLRVAFLCTRVARAIQSCGIPRFCWLNTKPMVSGPRSSPGVLRAKICAALPVVLHKLLENLRGKLAQPRRASHSNFQGNKFHSRSTFVTAKSISLKYSSPCPSNPDQQLR